MRLVERLEGTSSEGSRVGARIGPWLGMAVLAVGALLALPLDSMAQGTETYTFPGTDSDTQYTIGNFNNQAVSVTTSFFDGSTGESVQHVVVLAPGTQSRFTADSVGVDSFEGSTVVSADLPIAVTASVFDNDESFEHMSPVDASVEVVIPLGAFGGAQIRMAIFNPGTESALARVVQVDEDGNAVNFTDRTVEAKRTSLLQFAAQETARYAVIRTSNFFLGGRPVSVGAFIRNFVPPGGALKTDVAFVPGRVALTEAPTTRLPLFKSGSGFASTVQVVNDATVRQEITVTAVGLDGQPIAGGSNPETLADSSEISGLPGRGAHTESVEDLFAISDVELKVGSILVQGNARLSAVAAIGAASTPAFAILTADSSLVEDFAYQTRQVGREFVYLLSLLNPSSGAASVDMTFILDDGTVVSTVSIVIPAGSQVAESLASLFPEAQGNGAVVLHSDVPLLASGLESRRDDRATSVLRPLPAAADFMSAPPSKLFAVGTVRSNGLGLPGVTVTLSGTGSGTALTDAAGTFLFDDLSAGSYSLMAEAIGYTLSPPALNFSIGSESSRDNDFVATLVTPVITDVTPGAAPVGSASTDIVVEGGPFISGSVVVVGTTELATTVVSSELLLATIPASLLKAPLQLSLVVRNVGLGDAFVDSAPVTFTVGTPPPTLLSLEGQPEPLIAGSGGFTLTVNGAGFIPGATVSVDGVFRSALFVSDTRLDVAISTAELATGGFLPVRALNPGPAVPSNSLDLVVLNPPPDLTNIAPSEDQVRLSPTLPPLALTVNGAGFDEEAVVLVDSAPVPTVFVSASALTASVPSTLLSVSGVHDIQVLNPDPTVGPSFALPLTLTNPVPVLTSVSGTVAYDPGQAGADQPAPVLLNGSGFVTNSTVWASLPCDALGFRLLPNITVPSGETVPAEYATRRLSPNTLTATVNLGCAGNYQFQVRSPQPGGGTSATVVLTVP